MPRTQRLLRATARWDDAHSYWKVNAQIDGVRRTFYSKLPGNAGKRECEGKAEYWLQTRVGGENTRLEDALDAWLKTVKAQTSERNYRQYECYTRLYFKPFFAPYKASRLTAQLLEDCIEYAYTHPASGKALSEKTLKNIRGALTGWLKYMRKSGMTDLRLEDSLTINHNAEGRKTKRVLSFGEVCKLFSAEMDGASHIHYYRLLLLTGCRPSELLAVEEVNILTDRINIMGGCEKDGTSNRGKNKSAIRVIPLDDRMRKEIEAARLDKKRKGVISPRLFTIRTVDALYEAWRRLCDKHGIQPISLYELRHTNISYNKDTPDEYVKIRVGHTDAMDTRGVYSHELEDDVRIAGEYNKAAFDRILGVKQ